MINYDFGIKCDHCGKGIQIPIRDKKFGVSSPTNQVTILSPSEAEDIENFVVKCWDCGKQIIAQLAINMSIKTMLVTTSEE